ncbi:prepilin-type N-terminal cleavage/methylation domain-containing protein [Candidatus Saccharibacteria bacterium]|nr:prepilin-type N-terminal cleavage/methylation domain-containing protein [Candidatus Saccharibacteria bacterium]
MVSSRRINTSGFTIVELLIVIVVIGILAAITIVAYNGIQSRARAAAVSSALEQTVKKLALYAVDNNVFPIDLATIGIVNSGGTSYQYSVNNAVTPQTYCVTATNGTTFYRVNATNTAPSSGVCDGHLVGGVAAITNYATDPDAANSVSAFGFAGAPTTSTRTIASDRSYLGTTSLKTAVNGTGQIGAMARPPTSTTLRVNAGEKMFWSFWVYSTKAGSLIPYTDASKVSDGTYTGGSSASVAVPANVWTKVTGSFTPAIDIYPNQVGGYNLAVIAGDTLWFDAFLIEKSNTLHNYADGNSSNWTWNGAPNNSSSTGPAL